MSKLTVTTTPKIETYDFNEDQKNLIKTTIAKNATDDELKLFLYTAKRLGLDPLAKQIHFSVRTNKKTGERTPTFITSIDGYRLIADRTDLYAGNDDPVYDSEENPSKATVSVYKMIAGQRCAFTATARWSQYCPQAPNDFMWQKMPHLMLGKCAEALALRKAFPAELGGVYTEEEMHQAEAPDTKPIEITPKPNAPTEMTIQWQGDPKTKNINIKVIRLEREDIEAWLSVHMKDWTRFFEALDLDASKMDWPSCIGKKLLVTTEQNGKWCNVIDFEKSIPVPPAVNFNPNMNWNK